MASRSAEANAASVFGCLGSCYLVGAPFIGFYLMSYWLYLRLVFSVSYPFGLIAPTGTTLVHANKPAASGALLLASSLASAAATLLFTPGFGEPLAGALCSSIAGTPPYTQLASAGALQNMRR